MKHTAPITPDFQPLRPAGASEVGVAFGFTVLANGEGRRCKLRFSISAATKPESWLESPTTYLRLDICPKTSLGRLIKVEKDSKDARKLEVMENTGRALFFFPYSGKATELFPSYNAVCLLDIVSTTEDAITFKLPELETAE